LRAGACRAAGCGRTKSAFIPPPPPPPPKPPKPPPPPPPTREKAPAEERIAPPAADDEEDEGGRAPRGHHHHAPAGRALGGEGARDEGDATNTNDAEGEAPPPGSDVKRRLGVAAVENTFTVGRRAPKQTSPTPRVARAGPTTAAVQ